MTVLRTENFLVYDATYWLKKTAAYPKIKDIQARLCLVLDFCIFMCFCDDDDDEGKSRKKNSFCLIGSSQFST